MIFVLFRIFLLVGWSAVLWFRRHAWRINRTEKRFYCLFGGVEWLNVIAIAFNDICSTEDFQRKTLAIRLCQQECTTILYAIRLTRKFLLTFYDVWNFGRLAGLYCGVGGWKKNREPEQTEHACVWKDARRVSSLYFTLNHWIQWTIRACEWMKPKEYTKCIAIGTRFNRRTHPN